MEGLIKMNIHTDLLELCSYWVYEMEKIKNPIAIGENKYHLIHSPIHSQQENLSAMTFVSVNSGNGIIVFGNKENETKSFKTQSKEILAYYQQAKQALLTYSDEMGTDTPITIDYVVGHRNGGIFANQLALNNEKIEGITLEMPEMPPIYADNGEVLSFSGMENITNYLTPSSSLNIFKTRDKTGLIFPGKVSVIETAIPKMTHLKLEEPKPQKTKPKSNKKVIRKSESITANDHERFKTGEIDLSDFSEFYQRVYKLDDSAIWGWVIIGAILFFATMAIIVNAIESRDGFQKGGSMVILLDVLYVVILAIYIVTKKHRYQKLYKRFIENGYIIYLTQTEYKYKGGMMGINEEYRLRAASRNKTVLREFNTQISEQVFNTTKLARIGCQQLIAVKSFFPTLSDYDSDCFLMIHHYKKDNWYPASELVVIPDKFSGYPQTYHIKEKSRIGHR